ncbi:MAG TPA: DUF4123 domain-containing protein [Caulobacteraceae bacterium]
MKPSGPARLYGVLDCSRSPELYEHAARLEPEASACLFEGRLDQRVRRVSPFVVELAPADPLSRLWRTHGWGRAWGILISSRATLPQVRRRLRHFTQVRLPDGSGPVLFRFWDPRVFRVYFPTTDPSALPGWFEDVDRYIVETPDGAGSVRYSLQGQEVLEEAGPRPAA